MHAQQQWSINSAGGCFEPEEGTVKTNFWMFGELVTGVEVGEELSSYNGFIPFAILEEHTALGIKEAEVLENLKAYPVPTNDKVQLAFEAKESREMRLELYDLNGQLVHSQDQRMELGNNVLQLNLTSYPEGSYLVRLSSGYETIAITRIMKTQ